MKIGQTQCPPPSYWINDFLILLCQLWVREKEGWMDGWKERELMEAEICRRRSFLNSWLRWQMWSRYLIAFLWRAKLRNVKNIKIDLGNYKWKEPRSLPQFKSFPFFKENRKYTHVNSLCTDCSVYLFLMYTFCNNISRFFFMYEIFNVGMILACNVGQEPPIYWQSLKGKDSTRLCQLSFNKFHEFSTVFILKF